MSKYLLAGILGLSLLVGGVMPAQAQAPTPTPAPVNSLPGQSQATPQPGFPGATPAASFAAPVTSADAFTFAQIKEKEILLTGPYDTYTFLFGLPADWQPTSSGSLNLFLTVSFNAGGQGQIDLSTISGGVMQVRLNGVTLGILQLNNIGEVNELLPIPVEALVSRRPDGRMDLNFILDSGLTCLINQQMNVIVHPNSQFVLPHQTQAPKTDLVSFPYPLYQDSIYRDAAVVVVPDEPSAMELQAAMTLAAGLSNLTSGNLTTTLTTASQLGPEQQEQNLVFVGKAGSLPQLGELALPFPVQGGQFAVDGGGPDDGIIQQVASPWSPSGIVLVASGNTDASVVKAAQAISTGVLRPNRFPNVAVVDQVQASPVPVSLPMEQTLGDLGYNQETLDRIGINTASYQFYLPPGQTLAVDAYFELAYGHSALLDYDRSGLVILMNDQPVGSVRFSAETAHQANNRVQVGLPASAALPGYNRLDLRATLALRDNCIGPDLNGQFMTIWPESRLHMPLNPTQNSAEMSFDLNAYPMPFILNPTLGNTAFILQRGDVASWQTALRIAQYLGDRANGPLTTMATFYGDEAPEDELSRYNLLIIGRPSQMPIVETLNDRLPAPFSGGSEIASESNMQVSFRVPADSSIGYVQLLPSPWNNQNLVIAALGNTPEGVQWAASSLVDAPMRTQLSGNFAAVNNQQVVTSDTRLSAPRLEAMAPSAPQVQVEQPRVDLSVPTTNRPTWMMPAIITAASLAGLVMLIALMGSISRNRQRRRLG